MRYFPLFLDLRGRRVLVVGRGAAAAQKAKLAQEAGATVVRVASGVAACNGARGAPGPAWSGRFAAKDLQGCALVFVCGADPATARRVSRAAKQRGVAVNVQDRAELSTFVMPAILDRDPVTVAVSTGGASPMLARVIRDRVAAGLPAATGRLAAVLGEFRPQVAARIGSFEGRRRFWKRAVALGLGAGWPGDAPFGRRLARLLDRFSLAAGGPSSVLSSNARPERLPAPSVSLASAKKRASALNRDEGVSP
jgi:uroporphyrin-III C-methyltransferase/precorrin-2 dehydrogenase/sirohydrochlorin ferrochelatase